MACNMTAKLQLYTPLARCSCNLQPATCSEDWREPMGRMQWPKGAMRNCQPASLHLFTHLRPPHLTPAFCYSEACPLFHRKPSRLRLYIPLQTQPVPPMNVNSDADVICTRQQQVVTVSYWLAPPRTDDHRRYNRSKRANSTSRNTVVPQRTCYFSSLSWRQSGRRPKSGPL